MQIYTESTRRDFGVNTESTQSNADLHRVYTEWFQVNTESTQSNFGTTESTQSLHRMILGLWNLYLNPESLPVDPELVRLDFEQR